MTEEIVEKLTDCGLTQKQTREWADTMSLMAWTCPGFRHIFYKLLTNHNGQYACIPTRDVPVAATDGRNILINPDTFFAYTLQERVFITAHEIVHNIYMDVPLIHRCSKSGTVPMDDGTSKPFNNDVMQRAMDYRINALLRDSRIGKPPKDCCLDDKIATAKDGITDTYKKLYEDYEQNGNMPGGGFDTVLQPNASTGQSPNAQGQNPQQWAVEVKAAQTLEAMRAQGKMAGALKRMFEEILDPQVPWTEKIRSIFSRKVGHGNYNWRKPDRRFIVRDLYMPSSTGHGAGWIVVWGDTSGSIGVPDLCQYMAELSAIVDECSPNRLTVIWCDAAIHRIDEIADTTDMAKLKYDAAKDGVGGGGGTSVQPVFDWIATQEGRPEVFIGFTDGYVDFPKTEPDFLTIWASTAKGSEGYPWGDVVEIKPKR
jgi:predicted metal-dependent peptidase